MKRAVHETPRIAPYCAAFTLASVALAHPPDDDSGRIDPTPDGNGDIERVFTPPEVTTPYPTQTVTVFYPPGGTPPASGWPVFLHSNAGLFKEPLNQTPGPPPSGTASSSGANGVAQDNVGPIGLFPSFGERGPLLYIGTTFQRLLYEICCSGWVVISVGSVGIDSDATLLGPNPNLFHPPGSADWNDFDLFYGEKDLVWARQWVAENAAELGIDNDLVVVAGTSSGSVYASFVALGPNRSFTGSTSSQSAQSTRCAGFVGFEFPSWLFAFDHSLPGYHWADANGDRAATIMDVADFEDVRENSPSRFVRDAGSFASTTPVFLAYDESISSTNFSRDGSSDPLLENLFDVEDIHSAWFGFEVMELLIALDPALHGLDSNLNIEESTLDQVTLPIEQGDLVDASFLGTVQGLTIMNRTLCWLAHLVSPTSAATSSRNGDGTNQVCYTTIDAPVLGEGWGSSVSTSAYPGTANNAFIVSYGESSNGSFFNGTEILVDPFSALYDVTIVSVTGASTSVSLDMPADPCLQGFPVYTQAGIFGTAGPKLCNAIDLTLGY